MTVRRHPKYAGWLVAGGLGVVCACAPPALPPPEELLRRISYLVLNPEISCEQLRDDFQLDGLPINDTPAEAGLRYEEYWVPASDGETLRIWYLPVERPQGVVIVSPGNTGPMSCYLFTTQMLTAEGWDVVIYDYEGFGGSSGEALLRPLRDDLSTVVAWTRAMTGFPQVTLFGMSLGAIPTVAVAVAQPNDVNGVALDSPIALAREFERFDVLVFGRSEELISALDPWMDSERVMAGLQQPLLVFLHELDFVTPPEDVEALYFAAAGPKQLVRFPELHHARGQFVRTDEYRGHLVDFLNAVWGVQE